VALQERFGVSERRACKVVGQPRSTQRLAAPEPADDELALRAFLRDFSRRRPRWGWRRAFTEAKRSGWPRVNKKRVHRLWREEGLRVPYRKRKKPLRGIGVAMGAFCPLHPNVVWAMDFQFDQTTDGRMLKLLNVIDERTRECLAIEVARSIDADGVAAVLERLPHQRPAPRRPRPPRPVGGDGQLAFSQVEILSGDPQRLALRGTTTRWHEANRRPSFKPPQKITVPGRSGDKSARPSRPFVGSALRTRTRSDPFCA
jgi:hypothetical protein